MVHHLSDAVNWRCREIAEKMMLLFDSCIHAHLHINGGSFLTHTCPDFVFVGACGIQIDSSF